MLQWSLGLISFWSVHGAGNHLRTCLEVCCCRWVRLATLRGWSDVHQVINSIQVVVCSHMAIRWTLWLAPESIWSSLEYNILLTPNGGKSRLLTIFEITLFVYKDYLARVDGMIQLAWLSLLYHETARSFFGPVTAITILSRYIMHDNSNPIISTINWSAPRFKFWSIAYLRVSPKLLHYLLFLSPPAIGFCLYRSPSAGWSLYLGTLHVQERLWDILILRST